MMVVCGTQKEGKMLTQFKKGTIELCVLKVISEEDLYGFEVIEKLKKPLRVNENTIYPILRRLTTQGMFETYEKKSLNGANRKYYTITDLGIKTLLENLAEWYLFLENMELILGGKSNE